MHPAQIAERTPERVAYVMAATARTVTFGELEACANRGAHLFRSLGLQRGDHIALLMENNSHFLKICSAAQRAGIFYTAISWRLQPGDIEYIVRDCGARIFISSHELRGLAASIAERVPDLLGCYMTDGTSSGFDSWEDAIAGLPMTPIADQSEGQFMLYSSGTTGRPKGVKRALSDEPYGAPLKINLLLSLYAIDESTVYLSPAPLYHAAPLAYCMGCLREGASLVIMEHFDAEQALALVDRYKVTHSQWVPTMFVRMLKLPEPVRRKYELSSLQCAIHAAAPCPIPIKREMIDWWGPILIEYYSGTEANGHVRITSEEWLAHPGSVGRPINCKLHICDDAGELLPPDAIGTIFMADGPAFSYHNDRAKTESVRHSRGWTTLGDVGYLDGDGYLYLTDRKDFMIISGGVNIYPQEAENVLITHSQVADVAVFGVPNADFGEEVKAVVQPVDWNSADASLAETLLSFCRAELGPVKSPRSVDFRQELPRHPTGKLYKRQLKDEYWTKHQAKP